MHWKKILISRVPVIIAIHALYSTSLHFKTQLTYLLSSTLIAVAATTPVREEGGSCNGLPIGGKRLARVFYLRTRPNECGLGVREADPQVRWKDGGGRPPVARDAVPFGFAEARGV
jgi:hypothetical protein